MHNCIKCSTIIKKVFAKTYDSPGRKGLCHISSKDEGKKCLKWNIHTHITDFHF